MVAESRTAALSAPTLESLRRVGEEWWDMDINTEEAIGTILLRSLTDQEVEDIVIQVSEVAKRDIDGTTRCADKLLFTLGQKSILQGKGYGWTTQSIIRYLERSASMDDLYSDTNRIRVEALQVMGPRRNFLRNTALIVAE